eukprot:Skav218620  [mRNA]  locus=scaffold3208:144679:145728:- [translate_table: standard]
MKEEDEEDIFGQEGNLVSQVKGILRDNSSRGDVILEFFQNTDDFAASDLMFFLSDVKHGTEKLVDQRCKDLQGPALYICSNKPLDATAIERMQRVGESAKSREFASTGRFGIGMNVMYRYSDCPQLLANDRLHFFDLLRNFVAQDHSKRGRPGRQFRVEKLQQSFPDSVSPFEEIANLHPGKHYPVIFRLPLRIEKSELGGEVSMAEVKYDLKCVQSLVPSMLLFAKWVKRISFAGPSGFTANHTAITDREQELQDFFASLPSKREEICHGEDKTLCVRKRVESISNGEEKVREWMVAHTLALSSHRLVDLCEALLPLASAAGPLDNEDAEGRTLGEFEKSQWTTRVGG